MTSLWGGRFSTDLDRLALSFTASIPFDQRLADIDIQGSIAHARMLGSTGIIAVEEAKQLIDGLYALEQQLNAGRVEFRLEDEDIHLNIERLLTEQIGAVAGKLHTGRSRNDQVALDLHTYLLRVIDELLAAIRGFQGAIVKTAERYFDVVVPGYTHLQRAQPILFSHHLLAYFWMVQRDYERFLDVKKRTDKMPLGAGALAGTSYPIDRQQVAMEMGYSSLYENSLDAVSDRDYLVEFLSSASILMMHLSRLAEELILWSSDEFGWIELSDAYCTGSSMMPQKKNPDVAELVRGKTGRVYGHLIGMLTVMKGLPMAYNKDFQEDKEGVFDTVDTLLPALNLFAGMIESLEVRTQRLAGAFDHDFSNATDIADYLVKKGMPFREAHEIVGKLVLLASKRGTNLAGLSFADFQATTDLFAADMKDMMNPMQLVKAREVPGGTGPMAVRHQLELAHRIIE
jgi:argininosuccinate lyase